MHSQGVLLWLDLIGIATIAMAGTLAAVARGLDLFGVLTIAVASSLGGGVLRDLLLGAVPPPGITDWRYLLAATAAGLVVFAVPRHVQRLRWTLASLDAAGLGLFVVAGTVKALNHHVNATGAIFLGLITGVGGGVIRDVLINTIPTVLRRELLAIPALLGAGVIVVLDHTHALNPWSSFGVGVLIAAFRMLALWRDWHAPRRTAISSLEPPASAQ